MPEPFVGEIRIFAGSFAPAGWAMCNGALMAISQNDTLFNLIGTTYGGDGQSTFGVPDLQGRVPIHAGQGPGLSQNYQIGEQAGVESVTINTNQLPIHTHPMLASNDIGDLPSGQGNILAQSTSVDLFIEDAPDAALANTAIAGAVGGSQPHDNMMPYLVLTFIISLFGVYPPPQ
jgi:microcystin-dependent protein